MRASRTQVLVWVSGVLGGVLFGVGMGVFVKLDSSSWAVAGVCAVVTGIPFGLAMGWWIAKWLRGMAEAEGDLPADKVESAHQAATGGPVPGDEDVRSAARRIAAHRLAEYSGRTRRLSIVTMVLLLVGALVGAVAESPSVLVWAIAPAAALYSQWYWPRRLRRRIRELTDAEQANTT